MDPFIWGLFGTGAIVGTASAAFAIVTPCKRYRQVLIMLAFGLLAFAASEALVAGSSDHYKHVSRWVGYGFTLFGLMYAFGRATCTRPSSAILVAFLAALSVAAPAAVPLMSDWTAQVLLTVLGLVIFVLTMLFQMMRPVYEEEDVFTIVSFYWAPVVVMYVPWIVKWAILFSSPIFQGFLDWDQTVLAYNILDIPAILVAALLISVFTFLRHFKNWAFYGWFVASPKAGIYNL